MEGQPREHGSRDLSTALTNQGTPGIANLHQKLGEEKGKETPSGESTPPRSLFSASSLQNCGRINFHCCKPLSLWYFVTVTDVPEK